GGCVGGADVANAAVLLEPAVELHLPLAVRLAVHAQSRKGKRLQPCLGNLALAALADAIASIVHATERLIDGLHLLAIPIAQDEIDLLVPSVAGEVVGVHALVFARVADLVQVLLNAAEELRTHLFERVPGFLEKRLAHFPTPPPSRGRESRAWVNPSHRGVGEKPGGGVVDGGIRHTDAHEVAVSRLAADRDLAVDLGGLVARPPDERSGPVSLPFDQDVHPAPDLRARAARGDARLGGHDAFPAPPLHALRNLRRMSGGFGTLLARVPEDADPIELELLQERAQLVHVGLTLPGESDDERRPQRDARHGAPDTPHQCA